MAWVSFRLQVVRTLLDQTKDHLLALAGLRAIVIVSSTNDLALRRNDHRPF